MNYAKLLEISSFFIWHIFLEFDKTQNMPSKIWQILGDALSEQVRRKGAKAKITRETKEDGRSQLSHSN